MKSLFLVALLIATQAQAEPAEEPKEEIRLVIKQNLYDIEQCYKDVLLKHPSAKAKIVVDFQIDDQGKLTKLSINKKKSRRATKKLSNCVLERFKTWSFPSAGKGQIIEVSYPFVLSPKE